MKEILKKDYIRNNKNKTSCIFLNIYRHGFQYQFLNKKARLVVYKILNVLYTKFICGCEFNFSTKIGEGLRLPHFNGIIVSKHSEIGKNCTIFHQVTIGVNEDKSITKAPIIGDNVYIGAGAKIIGEIKIGNNVKICANAVITKDVPDNCTVVGANKIINNENKVI